MRCLLLHCLPAQSCLDPHKLLQNILFIPQKQTRRKIVQNSNGLCITHGPICDLYMEEKLEKGGATLLHYLPLLRLDNKVLLYVLICFCSDTFGPSSPHPACPIPPTHLLALQYIWLRRLFSIKPVTEWFSDWQEFLQRASNPYSGPTCTRVQRPKTEEDPTGRKSGVCKEAKIDGQMALIAQSCPCTKLRIPTDTKESLRWQCYCWLSVRGALSRIASPSLSSCTAAQTVQRVLSAHTRKGEGSMPCYKRDPATNTDDPKT